MAEGTSSPNGAKPDQPRSCTFPLQQGRIENFREKDDTVVCFKTSTVKGRNHLFGTRKNFLFIHIFAMIRIGNRMLLNAIWG